jgi:hypothetical protein
MLKGDFSGLVNAGVKLVDPDTGVPLPNGFISPSRFSPAALKIAESLPRSTDPLGKVSVGGFTSAQDYKEFTIRGDYYHSRNHRFTGRTFFNNFTQPEQTHSLLNSARSWLARWQNHSGTYTWIISPSVVNNLVGAYTRLNSTSISGLRDKDGNRICYSQLIQVADPPSSPCSIEGLFVGGSFGIGQNFNFIGRWTWSVSDSITINKGRHLIVAGVDVLETVLDLATDWLALPIIPSTDPSPAMSCPTFSWAASRIICRAAANTSGFHATQVGSYVQDQIKVKPNLTVNVGLRWEPFFAPVPGSGRIPVFSPGQQSQRYKNAPVGLVFPGDPGISDAGLPGGLNYFDPRLGIAWQPGFMKHTSIRAAFGIFTSPVDYSSWNHTADTSPFSPTYNLFANDPAIKRINFDNPWNTYAPVGGKSPFPPFPSPGSRRRAMLALSRPCSSRVAGIGFKLARNQSWNLSIERFGPIGWCGPPTLAARRIIWSMPSSVIPVSLRILVRAACIPISNPYWRWSRRPRRTINPLSSRLKTFLVPAVPEQLHILKITGFGLHRNPGVHGKRAGPLQYAQQSWLVGL